MGLPSNLLSRRLPPRLVLPIIHLPQLWRISIPSRLMLRLNPVLKGLLILKKKLGSTVSCVQILTVCHKCDNYKSFSDRQGRCVDLKMCKLYTSLKHNASSCPGKDDRLPFDCYRCKSHSHITALCPNLSSESVASNFCFNVHQSPSHGERHLLPVLALTFYGIGKCFCRV